MDAASSFFVLFVKIMVHSPLEEIRDTRPFSQ
jgi:hypothetical protein